MKSLTQYIKECRSRSVNNIFENIDTTSVKTQSKSFKEIMSGFYKLGYDYYGTMYWTNKTINNRCPDSMYDILNKIYDIDAKSFNNKPLYKPIQYLDVYISSNDYDYDTKCPDYIFNWDITEKVIKFTDKDKNGRAKQYYCFWNPTYKYFYFINLKESKLPGFYDVEKLFNYWIEIKTEGVDSMERRLEQIYKEQQKEFERYNDEQNKISEYKEKYNNILLDIKTDYDNHSSDYKEIKYSLLDSNIKNDIRDANKSITTSNDWETLLSNDYFEVTRICGSNVANDRYIHIVNNKDLSNGYVYYTMKRNKWSLD